MQRHYMSRYPYPDKETLFKKKCKNTYSAHEDTQQLKMTNRMNSQTVLKHMLQSNF